MRRGCVGVVLSGDDLCCVELDGLTRRWGGQHVIGDEGVEVRSKARQGMARVLRAATSAGRAGSVQARPGLRTRPWALVNQVAMRRPKGVSW
jgi:hypothetical protein